MAGKVSFPFFCIYFKMAITNRTEFKSIYVYCIVYIIANRYKLVNSFCEFRFFRFEKRNGSNCTAQFNQQPPAYSEMAYDVIVHLKVSIEINEPVGLCDSFLPELVFIKISFTSPPDTPTDPVSTSIY